MVAVSAPGWTDAWVCTPQLARPDQLPPAPFTGERGVFVNTTLRQTVRVSIGGQRLRVRFSHAFGNTPLPLTAAMAKPRDGRCGVAGIEPGSARQLRFGGMPSVVLPPGGEMVSDPVDFPVVAGSHLSLTVYLPDGTAPDGVTAHPGSRTTSYLCRGDQVDAVNLPGAAPVDSWYLLAGVQVATCTAAAVLVGDSLTDGRGSTTNGNDRWPDQLADRLRARPRIQQVAVLNHAAGGTRLLDDGRGPDPVGRVVREALARPGCRWVLVFKGVNDIGTAPATEEAQARVADELVAAYERIIAGLHERGVQVYGATLLPFGGNVDYDDTNGQRERTRQQVNEWVRTSGRFDRIVDFDLVVRDQKCPRQLADGYDSGDHLHLNPDGYRALADAVPPWLFDPARTGPGRFRSHAS